MLFCLRSLTLLMIAFFFSAVPAFSFEGRYEQTISMAGRQVAHFKVTAKGDFVKTEFLSGDRTEYVLKNTTGTYNVMPDQQVALKLPDMGERPTLHDDMNNYQDFLMRNQGKRTGEENLQGKEADMYDFIDPMTQGNAKAWVWREKNIPLRIEVQANEGVLMVELFNFDLTTPIEDSTFEVPAEFKVVNLQPPSPDQGEIVPEAAPE